MLTQDEKERIKTLISLGYGTMQICKSLNRNKKTIRNFLNKNHLLTASQKKWKLIKTLAASRQSICNYCGKKFIIKDKKFNLCFDCKSIYKEKWRSHQTFEQIINLKLTQAKQKSQALGRDFDLTIKDILYLWGKQNGKCYYTDESMSQIYKNSLCFSIDRVDNNKGYVLENVVLCLKNVNKMKQTFSQSEFIELCRKVAYNHKTMISEGSDVGVKET